jgi:hypothetical protein
VKAGAARACVFPAYRLKKKQQDAMFEPWRDVAQPLDGDIREQAQALVRHIEEQYTEEVL